MPEIPADEIMTSAELRVVREWLGFTGEALALLLGVQDRTVRRWEAGTTPIPDGARLDVEQLEHEADDLVGAIGADLLDVVEVAVFTYRTDAEYWTHHPERRPYPASWHRAVIARVAQDVPGLSIEYWQH